MVPAEVIRATEEEKQFQIVTKENLNKANDSQVQVELARLQEVAVQNGNIFEAMMDAAKFCTLKLKLQT